MRKEVKNEFMCGHCDYKNITEHAEYECPMCGKDYVMNFKFIECDCKERVYLSSHTNICPNCGAKMEDKPCR